MALKNKIVTVFSLMAVLLSANPENLYSQDIPAVSTGEIQFYLDKAVFMGKDNRSFVEFYFMFFADQIKYTGSNKGELDISVSVKNMQGTEVAEESWTLEVLLDTSGSDVKTKVFYDQWNEYLKKGEYNIWVSATDKSTMKKGMLQASVIIPGINENKFSASEIEFVSSVEKYSGPEKFKKGDKTIIANASRRYGVLNPILYFYYELYNMVPDKGNELSINYSISGLNSEKVKSYPVVQLSKNNPTVGITHGLNVGNLPSGIYMLNINISDSESNGSLNISRSFEIIQIDYTARDPSVTEEDSEIFEKLLSIIGNDSQIKNYRSLSANGKASYMVEFWKSMDPSPGTVENEYLKSIQQRFYYANKNYSWGETEGWQSERGRVLIRYGNPDEIEQHHSESSTYAFEIWIYNQERRYIFVFGDLNNNGRYVLLHSDKEGEISNRRWKDFLQKM